jgi:GalNAc-alpha-(1->4)-GalNAc-alpha-(1->3)-diNAcBac-PP-undecaprenol alpha-1,4-N-acetyl-D-galactosaminyltransferase
LRIILFLSSLEAGGAERVAIRVCEWLSSANHEVCLLTLANSAQDFYKTPKGVTRIGLDLMRPSSNFLHALANNIVRLFKLRKAIKHWKADVTISLCNSNNAMMLMALTGFNCRKIISERVDPVREPPPPLWQLAQRYSYPMAHLHVSQSEYVSQWLHRRFPKLQCVVIGNTAGLPPPKFQHQGSDACRKGRGLRIITVGRLTQQKGVDILLQALADARAGTSMSLELCIAGDGEERGRLEAIAQQLGLAEQVTFLGVVDDIWPELAASDIFVLASRWEGFPNALVEAMSAGLPVIAARCDGGVNDILENASSQVALEFPPGDIKALSCAIVQLAHSSALRQRLSLAGRARADDFHPEAISLAWQRAVESVCVAT